MRAKKKNKESKGFTLFEFLVIFFIISLISSILIVNWRKNERQYQLQRAAQEIAQNIRKTQDMALNIYKYRTPWLALRPFSFGTYLRTSVRDSYIIFADTLLNDHAFWLPGLTDQLLEDVIIDQGIEIDSFYTRTNPGSSLISRSRLHITFSIPDGFNTIKSSVWGSTCYSAVIRIRKEGGSCPNDCKDIVIERTGRVSVQ